MTALHQNHPYRHAERVSLCKTCKAPALALCPVCGSPFCGDHVVQNGACPDCELALSGRAGWAASAGLGFALIMVGVIGWLSQSNGHLVWPLGGLGVVGTLLIAALVRWLIRRRADRSWALVDGVELQISGEPGQPLERRLGWLMGGRGGDPYDQYGAAYEAGFNRVQGCP